MAEMKDSMTKRQQPFLWIVMNGKFSDSIQSQLIEGRTFLNLGGVEFARRNADCTVYTYTYGSIVT